MRSTTERVEELERQLGLVTKALGAAAAYDEGEVRSELDSRVFATEEDSAAPERRASLWIGSRQEPRSGDYATHLGPEGLVVFDGKQPLVTGRIVAVDGSTYRCHHLRSAERRRRGGR